MVKDDVIIVISTLRRYISPSGLERTTSSSDSMLVGFILLRSIISKAQIMEPRQGKQAPPIHTYLDTVHWSFYFDVEKPGFIRSKVFELTHFDDISLCLQFVTSSDTAVTIELLRVLDPSKPRDDGYLLEVHITLIGSRVARECRIMDSDDYVSVNYEIADLKNSNAKGSWVIRCVIKMKERTFLNNDLRNQQENLLRVMENNQSYGKVSKEKIHAMASLLKRKSISKIFTGRQSHSFAINKIIFIERTLRYAEEINKKLEAKKRNESYVQKHQPLNYLYHIYCEEYGKISVREAADLFVSAHYYGLEYLQVECVEMMLKDLKFCNELFTEVLLVADFVIDRDLLDKVLEIYVANAEEILETTQFLNVIDSPDLYSCSMVHVLTMKTKETMDKIETAATGTESKPPDSPEKSYGRKYGKKRHGKDWSQSISDATPGTSTDRKSKLSPKRSKKPKAAATAAVGIFETPATATIEMTETPAEARGKKPDELSTAKGEKHETPDKVTYAELERPDKSNDEKFETPCKDTPQTISDATSGISTDRKSTTMVEISETSAGAAAETSAGAAAETSETTDKDNDMPQMTSHETPGTATDRNSKVSRTRGRLLEPPATPAIEISKKLTTAADEISENLVKAADEISENLVKAADERSENLVKAADEISKILVKAADELSKILVKAANEISEKLAAAAVKVSETPAAANDGKPNTPGTADGEKPETLGTSSQ